MTQPQPQAQLAIYKSSAGSGKTTTLVREYLRLALAHPAAFQHVLAITFTRKATEEIKLRIVSTLSDLAYGRPTKMLGLLMQALAPWEEREIRRRARLVLDSLLHAYPRFSVSTIDSFFQKVLRGFARELELPPVLNLEMDTRPALTFAIDTLFEQVGRDAELTGWMKAWILEQLHQGKANWNLDQNILALGNELFRETLLALHPSPIEQHPDRESLNRYREQLTTALQAFQDRIRETATAGKAIMDRLELQVEDFNQSTKGVGQYITNLARDTPQPKRSGSPYEPNSYVRKVDRGASKWQAGKIPKEKVAQIDEAVEEGLAACLHTLVQTADEGLQTYQTVRWTLNYLYIYGLLAELLDYLRKYRTEKEVLLLADTNPMIQKLVADSGVPFMFEKIGSWYHHLLLDEFQDTSQFQWDNLRVLVENSLSEGHSVLVVGDIKQSIYRWRGGNLDLLLHQVQRDMAAFEELTASRHLNTNFRSLPHVIRFNNSVFTRFLDLLDQDETVAALLNTAEGHLVREAYSDVVQQLPASRMDGPQGYVQVAFYESEQDKELETDEADHHIPGRYRKQLAEMAEVITQLVDEQGYSLRDIAVLVRDNREASLTGSFLIEAGFRAISQESLRVGNDPGVRLLVAALRVLYRLEDTDQDRIAQTELIYHYTRYIRNHAADLHTLFTAYRQNEDFRRYLPKAFLSDLPFLPKRPLYDLIEELIRCFGLSVSGNPFVLRFLDQALDYQQTHSSSLAGFLDWWTESGCTQAVIIPEDVNALQVMTLHKSKGLEFPVVLIPFANWPFTPKPGNIHWVDSHSSHWPVTDTEAQLMPQVFKSREDGEVQWNTPDGVRFLPVKGLKDLTHSRFSDSWNTERRYTLLDNLNLLYVALTRAKEQLWVWAPLPNLEKKTRSLDNVGHLLYYALSEADASLEEASAAEYCPLNSFWDAEHLTFRYGTSHEGDRQAGSTTEHTETPLRELPSRLWRSALTIRPRAQHLQTMLDPNLGKRLNWGTLVHDVLSKIETTAQLEQVIDLFHEQGYLNASERLSLKQDLEQILSMPEVQRWFQPGWQLKTEKDLILPDGRIFRPDRVLINGSQAVVIDYKTGRRSQDHLTQIRVYGNTLRAMGYDPVEEYLLYLQERAVVPA